MDQKTKTFERVKQIFRNYLQINDFRKTPERFAILEEIYSREDHFDAEALYIQMKSRDYRVSRATVYNTLELLVECDLVRKQQFGKNTTHYEKSFGTKQHDHMICDICGKLIEFCDPRVQQTKNMVHETFGFTVHHHALIIHGICKDCQKDLNTDDL